jgi:hypothetical protein
MSKVNEKDEAEKDKYRGANQSDIVPPEHEEPVWDGKRETDENQPEEHFRSPPPVKGVRLGEQRVNIKTLTHSV